jgi:hypothetical protein
MVNRYQGKNNMLKMVKLCLIGSLLFSSLVAQAERVEYNVPDDISLVEGPDMMQFLEEYKSSKGWHEMKITRKDGSSMIVVKGIANVSAPRTSPNFIASRQIAFDKAMLQAKKELVEFLETEISGELTSYFSEPSEKRQEEELIQRQREGLVLESAKDVAGAAAEDVGIFSKFKVGKVASDKAKDLLIYEANLKLKELGYDPNKPVDEQTLRKITQSDKFSKSISSVAKSRVVGLQAFKVFENHGSGKKGEIGVIAIWSPKLNAVANAIYSGDMSFIPPAKKGKKPFKDQIPQNPEVLMSTFGARQFIGEDGGYGVMAFAQVGPKSNNSRSINAAYNKAKLNAMFMIRQFAGEVASVQVDQSQDESTTKYADKMEAYEYDESYQELIKSNAEAINISGLQTLKSWKAIHPLTKTPVVGSVVLWTPSGYETAVDLKKDMNTKPKKNISNGSSSTVVESPYGGEYGAASDEADEDAF